MLLSTAKRYLAHSLFGFLSLAFTACVETTDPEPDPNNPNPTDSLRKTGWAGSDNPNAIPENINNPFSGDPASLPASVDLTPYFPPVGDQGQYGTCVAWAAGYNAKTAIEAIKFGLTPQQLASPAFQLSAKYLFTAIADQKKGTDCNGTDFTPALDVLIDKGIATKTVVPYTDLGNCANSRIPSDWHQDAAKHKIKYYRRIDNDLNSVKMALANKHPVILGAKLDDSFMSWNSETVYQTATSTEQVGIHSYHAMCIVGYDNSKGPRGAFKVVNSWGTQWGSQGFIWVDYNFMFNGFSFNRNFFIAVNDEQRPNPNTPDPPSFSGVEIIPWVEADLPDAVSGQNTRRKIQFDIYNTGAAAANASTDWGYAYLYYNAFDANDYGIIFYDRLLNTGAYKSFEFGQTDPGSNSYGFTIHANIPSNGKLSGELFTGDGMIRTYFMPENLTGFYYLVLVADATDKFTEKDEANNLFYTTPTEPKLFENGMGARVNTMAQGFRNHFRKSQMQSNEVRSHFYTAVNSKHPNAYTPEEILGFIKREARNGNLAKKIAQSQQNRGQMPVTLQRN
jgi:C1A family cysteine protease